MQKVKAYYDASGVPMAIYSQEVADESTTTKTEDLMVYGLSRIGTYHVDETTGGAPSTLTPTKQQFELTDHLGNVRAVVTGELTSGNPDVVSLNDYYAFGSSMRSFSSQAYRYGYQGSEKETETFEGAYSTYFRMLDTRLGRWFSPDPITMPWQSPYTSMDNNPVALVDPYGANTIGQKGGNGPANSTGGRQTGGGKPTAGNQGANSFSKVGIQVGQAAANASINEQMETNFISFQVNIDQSIIKEKVAQSMEKNNEPPSILDILHEGAKSERFELLRKLAGVSDKYYKHAIKTTYFDTDTDPKNHGVIRILDDKDIKYQVIKLAHEFSNRINWKKYAALQGQVERGEITPKEFRIKLETIELEGQVNQIIVASETGYRYTGDDSEEINNLIEQYKTKKISKQGIYKRLNIEAGWGDTYEQMGRDLRTNYLTEHNKN